MGLSLSEWQSGETVCRCWSASATLETAECSASWCVESGAVISTWWHGILHGLTGLSPKDLEKLGESSLGDRISEPTAEFIGIEILTVEVPEVKLVCVTSTAARNSPTKKEKTFKFGASGNNHISKDYFFLILEGLILPFLYRKRRITNTGRRSGKVFLE